MSQRDCPKGHPLPPNPPEGLCPECLLLLAVPEHPTEIDGFRILRALGEGGFGRVFLASRGGQQVALKVMRDSAFANARARKWFYKERELLSELRDPGIVPIREVGKYKGSPYFTMEYMSGGTLRQRMTARQFTPREAAELMIRIAQIVQFLHSDPGRAPVLHRDLRPENILFDSEGKPRVADFGIAKVASEETVWSAGTNQVGCAPYMAPERFGVDPVLTAASDVYSLGVMLYELLTGSLPFENSEPRSRQIPPRRSLKHLQRFLRTFVLNALEKEPALRYQTAQAFAEDLQRALDEKPPQHLPLRPVQARIWHWVRRTPFVAAVLVWVAAFVVVVSQGLNVVNTEQRRALDQRQLDNSAMASLQAVAMKFQLQEYARRMAELARDPAVRSLLNEPTIVSPAQALIDRMGPFNTVFVMAADGQQRARSTRREWWYLKRSFAFRDYFRSARLLAQTVCHPAASGATKWTGESAGYIARAYSSEHNGMFEFAISAPVCDERGWVGIVAGTIPVKAALGSVLLADDDERHISALIGPRDNERMNGSRALPTGFTFVAHPRLQQGELREQSNLDPTSLRAELGIPSDSGARRYTKPLRIDDYVDPLFPSQRWAAAFAPVGVSGYVVVVQTRRESPSVPRLLFDLLAVPAGIPLSLALAVLVALKLAQLQRPKRPSVQPIEFSAA